MATVEFRQASRIYDPEHPPAVNRVNLTIHDGEFLVLVGPSGCGKSTTLRMLAGLEPVDEGSVLIDGEDVSERRARDRDVAMVFQSYALYPNMTARQNMAFALENARIPKAEIAERVERAAEMLQLTELLDTRPGRMSGGQRQRVAMGRAIARAPRVFCMDEPLSSLDARPRVSTRGQISSLQRRLGVTTVYVTHDQTEAMTMGDRVAVMKDGLLQQVASPLSLYDEPANLFVAGFIGSPAMTLLKGDVTDGGVGIGGSVVPVAREVLAKATTGKVVVGVRPEHLSLTDEDGVGVDVTAVEQTGADAYVYGTVAGTDQQIVARLTNQTPPPRGAKVHFVADPTKLHVFDEATELRIS